MIVILNSTAGGGRALEKWKRIEADVRELLGPHRLVVAKDAESVRRHVIAALRKGETRFIAAGGDGTVNLVMASIIEGAPAGSLPNIKLGAIGLGSSNDFHKRMSDANTIEGVPIKLDFVAASPHDVCRLTYMDENGELRSRPWLINASIGTTAEANRFFNEPNALLRFLKRTVPSCAMIYAALRTLVGFKSQRIEMTLDETQTVHTSVKNLGIVKNQHFTGSLSYDSPYEPNSGHMYVHLLKNVASLRLALTLLGLLQGRFSGKKGTRSWRATRLRIRADEPFAVEGDGEVVTAKRAYFTVIPGLLQVCM